MQILNENGFLRGVFLRGQNCQSGLKSGKVSLRLLALPLLLGFFAVLTALETRSAQKAFQKVATLWETELSTALLSGDRNFADKLSKSIATGQVERIEITTPQGTFASFPHTLTAGSCSLPVSYEVKRYGIILGTIGGCLSLQAILKSVLLSPFLIVFIAFWFVLVELARIARQEAKLKIQSANQISKLAKQVAHDIRSPLAALDSVSQSLTHLPEKKRVLILSAIERIHGIANTLLDTYRGKKQISSQVSIQSIMLLTQSLISEKQAQFAAKKSISIETSAFSPAEGAFAHVDPVAFKRVLSNLINNSVEHLGKAGKVVVSVKRVDDTVLVSVEDNGSGIPANILSRLMKEEISHGKKDGNGIGLVHAKECVEAWGGKIEIRSKEDVGTTIVLRMPSAKANKQPGPVGKPDFILIDDNPLGLMTWETAAEEDGQCIRVFSSFEEFVSEMNLFDKQTPIYLDWDLGDNPTSGLEAGEIIAKRGFQTIYITTGYESSALPSLPWVKQIVGKSPPWRKG